MQNQSPEDRIVIAELEKLLQQAARLQSKPDTSLGAVDMWVRRVRHNFKLIYGRDAFEVELMPAIDKLIQRVGVHEEIAARVKVVQQYVIRLKAIAKTDNENRRADRIFIGHGRSLVWRELKDFVVEDAGLLYDEFDRISVAGRTITDRLNEMLNDAMFALIVLTAEDEQLDGTQRARQNVVHEAGLFQGRLGFDRALLLVEESVAEFSNSSGLIQIRFPRGHISAVFHKVQRALQQGGVQIAR